MPLGVSRSSFSLYCTFPGAYRDGEGGYRNGESIYTCTCGVVEYRASENITPAALHTAQPQGAYRDGEGDTGTGKVFTLAHVGWWNIVQTRMLHRLLVGCCQCRERWQHIRAETSKRQKGEIWWNNSGMNHAFSFWFLTICFHEFFWCEYLLLWNTTTRQKLHCVCVIKQQRIQKIRFHLKKRVINTVLHVQYISKAIRKST